MSVPTVLVQEDVASVISGTFLSSITTGNMSSITNENTQVSKKRINIRIIKIFTSCPFCTLL